MQTMYYSTQNYIRHTGNVVDLNEYRRKLAAVQVPALRPFAPEMEEEAPVPVRPRKSEQRRALRSMLTELVSTAAVLLTTLIVTVQMLG